MAKTATSATPDKSQPSETVYLFTGSAEVWISRADGTTVLVAPGATVSLDVVPDDRFTPQTKP
ncbi:MAG: hypothetical protein ACYDA6_00130 [Solirubrobacteraceae bacterium]